MEQTQDVFRINPEAHYGTTKPEQGSPIDNKVLKSVYDNLDCRPHITALWNARLGTILLFE
jgi:hypothetical protein